MFPYRLRLDLSRLTLFRIDYLARIGLTIGFLQCRPALGRRSLKSVLAEGAAGLFI